MLTRAEVQDALRGLRADDGVWFHLPGAQPHNRVASQTIASVAHALWGAGSYRLQSAPGRVGIVRRKQEAA